jgi:hypothetical protein
MKQTMDNERDTVATLERDTVPIPGRNAVPTLGCSAVAISADGVPYRVVTARHSDDPANCHRNTDEHLSRFRVDYVMMPDLH